LRVETQSSQVGKDVGVKYDSNINSHEVSSFMFSIFEEKTIENLARKVRLMIEKLWWFTKMHCIYIVVLHLVRLGLIVGIFESVMNAVNWKDGLSKLLSFILTRRDRG
jgi:hypothetical protein